MGKRKPTHQPSKGPEAGYIVEPDYPGVWCWEYLPAKERYMGRAVGEGPDWLAYPPIPLGLIDDFNRWQDIYEFGDLGTNTESEFNWVEFHCAGIELAKRLKQAIGEKYIVLYLRAFEDATDAIPKMRLVKENLEVVPFVHRPK